MENRKPKIAIIKKCRMGLCGIKSLQETVYGNRNIYLQEEVTLRHFVLRSDVPKASEEQRASAYGEIMMFLGSAIFLQRPLKW